MKTVRQILWEMVAQGNELTEAWEREGNRDADTLESAWPFSTERGAMSINEWVAELGALADEYTTPPN